MLFRYSCSKCLAVSWVECLDCKKGYCGNCSRKANGGVTKCPECGSRRTRL